MKRAPELYEYIQLNYQCIIYLIKFKPNQTIQTGNLLNIIQPTNQPTNQPINQTTNQPAKQPNQLTNQPTNQPTY